MTCAVAEQKQLAEKDDRSTCFVHSMYFFSALSSVGHSTIPAWVHVSDRPYTGNRQPASKSSRSTVATLNLNCNFNVGFVSLDSTLAIQLTMEDDSYTRYDRQRQGKEMT